VVIFAGVLVGCSGQQATAESDASSQQPEPVAAAASHAANQPELPQMVSGEVLETMDSSGYTYVRLATDDGEIWAASNQFQVAVGDRVMLPLETPMQNFHSASLDRDFDLIYFASFIVPEGENVPMPSGAGAGELPPGHPSLESFQMPSSDSMPAAMGAPPGGITIADLWQRKAELAGSQVTVQGRVVKYNAAILGRNWLHLEDGSGELEQGTNDITVTTTDEVAIGDVVTATGTVSVDRDFGAGYTYTVMLEDATVTPR
jgi:hypothetical protein